MHDASSRGGGYLPPLVKDLVYYDFQRRQASSSPPPLPSLRFLSAQGNLNLEALLRVFPDHVHQPSSSLPPPSEPSELSTGKGQEKEGQVFEPSSVQELDAFKNACMLVLQELHQHFLSESKPGSKGKRLVDCYSEQLQWLAYPGQQAAELWLELFAASSWQDQNAAWLVGTTVLEQMLGNIVSTLQGPEAFVPFLIRDLVSVPCLIECVDPILIRVLKMLLGSPRTLNVRNLVWHGFITTNDQGRLPLDAYGAMLITLTMTIATNAQRYFKASSTISLNIRYLNPKTFYFGDATTMTTLPISSKATTKTGLTTRRLDDICEFDPIYAQCAFGSTPIAQTNDSVELVSKLKDLIHSSSFVIPGTENQWNQSCQYLLPICQSVLDGQPSEEVDHTFSPFLFVISTLPLVEHALRLKYVDVNKCKKDRQFALIQGEYYLTMDVILDSAVPQEYFDPKSPADGDAEKDSDTVEIRNRLRGELGSGIMNLAEDLFIHDFGPRLRDRASHGELNTFFCRDITHEAWFGYYLGWVVALLDRYSHQDSTVSSSSSIESWIGPSYSKTARFDSLSILKREVVRGLCLVTLFRDTFFCTYGQTLEEQVDLSAQEMSLWVRTEMTQLSGTALALLQEELLSSNISFTEQAQQCLSFWEAVLSSSPNSGGDRDKSGQASPRLECQPRGGGGALGKSEPTTNVRAWIVIAQSIQSMIQKVSDKVLRMSEQQAQRKLSSRARKQLDSFKPMVPRLFGMMIGCLVLVERFAIVGDACSASAESTGGEGEGDRRRQRRPKKEQGSKDLRMRIKVATFVDKFGSSLDRQPDALEVGWRGLRKQLVEEQ